MPDGFTFFSRRDTPGYDIQCSGSSAGDTAASLAAQCLSRPSCRSFNMYFSLDFGSRWHCLKWMGDDPVTDETLTGTMPYGQCYGIWVKNPGEWAF